MFQTKRTRWVSALAIFAAVSSISVTTYAVRARAAEGINPDCQNSRFAVLCTEMIEQLNGELRDFNVVLQRPNAQQLAASAERCDELSRGIGANPVDAVHQKPVRFRALAGN